jgi:O-antigen ligase
MFKLGVAILILILVTTGSFIRVRSLEESDSADWLVFLQFALCLTGGLVGTLLLKRQRAGGTASKLLMAYIAALILSALFSVYSTVAAGYWVLLAGTSVLYMGLLSNCPDEASLHRIEFAIFAALTLMIAKDALLSWFVLAPVDYEELFRLGENTTSSNALALMTALAFFMSFGLPATPRNMKVRYAWRILFIVVMMLTRTRVALIGLVLGGCARLWYGRRSTDSTRARILAAAIPCWIGSLALVIVIAWTMGVQPVTAMVEYVNRSEDSATLMTFTGRTDVWNYAIDRTFESFQSTLIGHGYGASKLVLNENNWRAGFYAYHAHNTLLEAMLGTGLIGTIPFILLVAYSTTWLFRFTRLRASFSLEFALRAIAVITIILGSTLTESDLVTKVGPVTIVFLFYVLALDRQKCFTRRAYVQ